MGRKLQGFFCFKISSKRLSKSKYNINLDITTARKNGEIVKIGDSALLEVVRRVSNHPYNPQKLLDLNKQRMIISKQSSSEENKRKLLSILKEIDDCLLIDSIVSVAFDNKTHYEKIYNQGLFINGKKYIRILAGAANLRKQVVFFLREDLYEPVMKILECGRNTELELNPSKYSAYFGLYNSASHPVSFPKFIVIPDAEYPKTVRVDWIDDNNEISEVDKEITFNYFDGQGIASPRLAKAWANELKLDWTPSTYIVRFPFGKGQVCVFDFHEFGSYVAKETMVKDIWGDYHDIRDVDLVLTQSQLKLWDSYANQREYIQKCHDNGLGFRITRYSQPLEKIKQYSYLNYMFVQVLDLTEDEIKKLCAPTLEYFRDLMGGSREKMLTFLYPENTDVNFQSLEPIVQALMLDDEFAKEPFIQKRFTNALRKKVKEAYLGNLILPSNFQPMISDPYAMCEHLFGLEVRGLLEDGENYCEFWSKKGVKEVATARSPLTHSSEFNRCKLVDEYLHRDWYAYTDNGFIMSVNGKDVLVYADSDK